MNKLYSQIASLLVVVGLGTAWAFKLLTFEQLGTGATALLGLIYGLYQKYEKGVIETKSLKLEDQLKVSNAKVINLSFSKEQLLKKYDEFQKSILKSELITTDSETPVEVVEKPKRKYYKSKKS